MTTFITATSNTATTSPHPGDSLLPHGTGQHVKVDVWADIACPWCYLGKRRLDEAAASFTADREQGERTVDIEVHSFELAPDLPEGRTQSMMDYQMNHQGVSAGDAVDALERMTRLGRRVGITYDFDGMQVTNSARAHQLMHYAKARGRQLDAEEALFAAYFTHGRNLGDISVLGDIADELGLDRADAIRALTANEQLSAFRADTELARTLGITAVPFLIVDGKYAVAGVRSAKVIEDALERAWSERQDVA